MDPITEIRKIAAESPDSWIGKCCERYLSGFLMGLTLDECCGLSGTRGNRSWWYSERLKYRNGCLRWYARYANARENMSIRAQAAEVHRAAERYRHGRWRFDKFKDAFQTGYFGRDDSKDEILYRLFSVSKDLNTPVPGERQIRRIIGPSSRG